MLKIDLRKKQKLEQLLGAISTPDEKKELQKLDALKIEEIVKFFNEIETDHQDRYKNLEKYFGKILGSFDNYRLSVDDSNKKLAGAMGSFSKELIKKIEAMGRSDQLSETIWLFSKTLEKKIEQLTEGLATKLGGTITTSYEKNKPFNAAGVYKDMINQLSAINDSVQKKPVPVWNWPQYASVGIRNKSFSNVDPASEDKAGTISIGTVSLASAGTAQQISSTSVPCYAVYVQAHEGNTNAVTIGDSTVVGALSGRKGMTLYPTNSQKFLVNNLNLLYFDGITTGDKIHYFVEKA